MAQAGANPRTLNRLRQRWHRTLGMAAWYKRASDYGESYSRPGFLLLGVLSLFAFLFPIFGLTNGPVKEPQNSDLEVSATNLFTYRHPYVLGHQDESVGQAQLRLFGRSFLTALEIAALQRDTVYKPAYPWGRLLALLEAALTSTLLALFLLAIRRQFRR